VSLCTGTFLIVLGVLPSAAFNLTISVPELPVTSAVSASGNSGVPILSVDGRYVVFTSAANSVDVNSTPPDKTFTSVIVASAQNVLALQEATTPYNQKTGPKIDSKPSNQGRFCSI